LESVVYGEIKAGRQYSDKDFQHAYDWLEKEVGFYPLFLAVGNTIDDIRMTRYDSQWGKIIYTVSKGNRSRNILRKAGEFPNYVLFSYENVDGVFTDFDAWHIVLGGNPEKVTEYQKKLIFKYSYKKSDWLRKARREPGYVQLVTPSLNLPDSDRIWVRNKKTKQYLEEMGLENIEVKSIKVLR